jgi:hypothetical protein
MMELKFFFEGSVGEKPAAPNSKSILYKWCGTVTASELVLP